MDQVDHHQEHNTQNPDKNVHCGFTFLIDMSRLRVFGRSNYIRFDAHTGHIFHRLPRLDFRSRKLLRDPVLFETVECPNPSP